MTWRDPGLSSPRRPTPRSSSTCSRVRSRGAPWRLSWTVSAGSKGLQPRRPLPRQPRRRQGPVGLQAPGPRRPRRLRRLKLRDLRARPAQGQVRQGHRAGRGCGDQPVGRPVDLPAQARPAFAVHLRVRLLRETRFRALGDGRLQRQGGDGEEARPGAARGGRRRGCRCPTRGPAPRWATRKRAASLSSGAHQEPLYRADVYRPQQSVRTCRRA